MERKKYILLVFFISALVSVYGQANSAVYTAYMRGNMLDWKNYIDAYKATSKAQKMELINYQYGYIAYCISQDKEDEAEIYLQKAEALILDLEKQGYELPMLYAYKAAFVGFKIGISPYKAPFIGHESIAFAKKSFALDSTKYFVYIQLGNIAFYTPSMFGGSKKHAMKHYLKALELMEENPVLLNNNWNYLNLLATVINAYFIFEKYELAKQYCIKTLAVEPEFDWVKNQLYPKILKKLRQ